MLMLCVLCVCDDDWTSNIKGLLDVFLTLYIRFDYGTTWCNLITRSSSCMVRRFTTLTDHSKRSKFLYPPCKTTSHLHYISLRHLMCSDWFGAKELAISPVNRNIVLGS